MINDKSSIYSPKYIYLDYSHLQKWSQSTLDDEQLLFLTKLLHDKEYRFVLSVIHIIEIIRGKDHKKALNIAKYLEGLPILWIRNPSDLHWYELSKAIAKFKGTEIRNTSPFVKGFIDTFEKNEDSLEFYLAYRELSIVKCIDGLSKSFKVLNSQDEFHKKRLNLWTVYNVNISKVFKKDEWGIEIINYFKIKLNRLIRDLNLYSNFNDDKDKFIVWIIDNLHEIPSIHLTFLVTHFILKNEGQNWKLSHLYDLLHLSALPYVDYFTCDRQMTEYTNQAIKYLNNSNSFKLAYKLNTSIKDLIDKISIK